VTDCELIKPADTLGLFLYYLVRIHLTKSFFNDNMTLKTNFFLCVIFEWTFYDRVSEIVINEAKYSLLFFMDLSAIPFVNSI
jgi:hypothetical protein